MMCCAHPYSKKISGLQIDIGIDHADSDNMQQVFCSISVREE